MKKREIKSPPKPRPKKMSPEERLLKALRDRENLLEEYPVCGGCGLPIKTLLPVSLNNIPYHSECLPDGTEED